MGFRPSKPYKLRFEQPELAGLEVVSRGVSVDGLLQLVELVDGIEDVDTKSLAPAEMAEYLKKVDVLLTRFGHTLIGWNVENDDGTPVPANRAGLGSQDFDFVMTLISAWLAGMSQAPPPLPGSSPSGASSEGASTPPMAALSPNPPSS